MCNRGSTSVVIARVIKYFEQILTHLVGPISFSVLLLLISLKMTAENSTRAFQERERERERERGGRRVGYKY